MPDTNKVSGTGYQRPDGTHEVLLVLTPAERRSIEAIFKPEVVMVPLPGGGAVPRFLSMGRRLQDFIVKSLRNSVTNERGP